MRNLTVQIQNELSKGWCKAGPDEFEEKVRLVVNIFEKQHCWYILLKGWQVNICNVIADYFQYLFIWCFLQTLSECYDSLFSILCCIQLILCLSFGLKCKLFYDFSAQLLYFLLWVQCNSINEITYTKLGALWNNIFDLLAFYIVGILNKI